MAFLSSSDQDGRKRLEEKRSGHVVGEFPLDQLFDQVRNRDPLIGYLSDFSALLVHQHLPVLDRANQFTGLIEEQDARNHTGHLGFLALEYGGNSIKAVLRRARYNG